MEEEGNRDKNILHAQEIIASVEGDIASARKSKRGLKNMVAPMQTKDEVTKIVIAHYQEGCDVRRFDIPNALLHSSEISKRFETTNVPGMYLVASVYKEPDLEGKTMRVMVGSDFLKEYVNDPAFPKDFITDEVKKI